MTVSHLLSRNFDNEFLQGSWPRANAALSWERKPPRQCERTSAPCKELTRHDRGATRRVQIVRGGLDNLRSGMSSYRRISKYNLRWSSAFLGSLGPIVSGRGGAAMYIAYKSEFEYASPSPSSSAHLPRRIQNSRTRQGQRGIACKRHARMEGRQDCIYSQGQQGPRSLISEPWLAGHRDAMHAVEKNAERCLRRRAEKDTWPREHRRRASGGKNERMRNPMARPAGEQTQGGRRGAVREKIGEPVQGVPSTPRARAGRLGGRPPRGRAPPPRPAGPRRPRPGERRGESTAAGCGHGGSWPARRGGGPGGALRPASGQRVAPLRGAGGSKRLGTPSAGGRGSGQRVAPKRGGPEPAERHAKPQVPTVEVPQAMPE
ncbi:unnamed protein product [Prorocentrum cordatum]|uniref:Uncharacterized protein n=1 Tax=Prorocentrum cordatum TaxID=2364126 RepID=A0ABN9QUR6_9DINO|nr:unnamed protein product [Polarella glacialis]